MDILHSTDFLGCIFYGCYIVLFFQSLYVLKRRKQDYHRIQVLLLTALFFLATAALAVMLAVNNHSRNFGSSDTSMITWAPVVRLSLLFVANLIADSILLWRCYVVWGKRRKVIALPMILCLANHVLALVVICRFRGGWQFSQSGIADYDPSVPMYSSFDKVIPANYITCGLYLGSTATNMLLTIMIAGRLVFISRRTRAILGPKHGDLYTFIVAVTIESGLLYPLILTIYAGCILVVIQYDLKVLPDPPVKSPDSMARVAVMADVIQEAIIHAIGISQTLIIVRIALGLSFSSVEEAVATLGTNGKQSTAATLRSVLDISARNRPVARRHSFDSLRPAVSRSDSGSAPV